MTRYKLLVFLIKRNLCFKIEHFVEKLSNFICLSEQFYFKFSSATEPALSYPYSYQLKFSDSDRVRIHNTAIRYTRCQQLMRESRVSYLARPVEHGVHTLLLQIHFGSGAARIRNYFFLIRIQPKVSNPIGSGAARIRNDFFRTGIRIQLKVSDQNGPGSTTLLLNTRSQKSTTESRVSYLARPVEHGVQSWLCRWRASSQRCASSPAPRGPPGSSPRPGYPGHRHKKEHFKSCYKNSAMKPKRFNSGPDPTFCEVPDPTP
jgi:hypothetical protein